MTTDTLLTVRDRLPTSLAHEDQTNSHSGLLQGQDESILPAATRHAVLNAGRANPAAIGTRSAVAASPDGQSRRQGAILQLTLLASIVASFLAGSSAPTPLYSTYQHAWGFSLVTTTTVFAVYAITVLGGLLFLGRLSNYVGRKPVILGAIAIQIAAMFVFASAGSLNALFAARILQGVATGGALGAIGAAMVETHPRHGAAANSAAAPAGTGIGALLSGLLVSFLPGPTHTVYLVLAAVLIFQFAAAGRVLPSTRSTSGVLRSFAPKLSVPAETRHAVFVATPFLFAVWALAGFYGALSPALLGDLSKSPSVVLGGFGLFLLAIVAAIATLALKDAKEPKVLAIGLVALALGVGGVMVSIAVHSTALLLMSTAISGIGFGGGFQGALRVVLANTPAMERAGVLSTLYVISYLGMGIPAVAAGWLVVHGHSLTTVAEWYGAFLLVLTGMTSFSLRRLNRSAS